MKPTTMSDASQHEVTLPPAVLVRPREAAHLLGVGRSTIYELMRAGELPVVHIGRAARIPTAAIQEWVEHHTPSPSSSPAAPPFH